jgi:hypothetical protein
MAVIALEGISVEVTMKTMPEVIDIKFSLASLEIEDHRVREAVKRKNPNMSDVAISEKVLETWQKQEMTGDLLTVQVVIMEAKVKKPDITLTN